MSNEVNSTRKHRTAKCLKSLANSEGAKDAMPRGKKRVAATTARTTRPSFGPNSKVVCVDDANFIEPDVFSELPVRGRVYCVRGLVQPTRDWPDAWGVLLVGIQGKILDFGEDGFHEVGFIIGRFRVVHRG